MNIENNNSLLAISPIDGRYFSKTKSLNNYFSEFALIKTRVFVEYMYYNELCEVIPNLKKIDFDIEKFSLEDAQKIKDIEKITNHDVKAVEYFIKERFDDENLSDYKEFIHLGLTSQDINNTAFPILLKGALKDVIIPNINEILSSLKNMIAEYSEVSMLARTHGQPASPTTLGKEIAVFEYRLAKQKDVLLSIPVTGKFGGATGNFNAHKVTYPEIDWNDFANNFLYTKLGIVREQLTTQISNYDSLAAICDCMKRINTILLDLCKDFWQYISMEYFKQKINKNEVGSSAMPHKVNPIDFENAEGNLGMANAIFEHLAAKLPISRLQRDLTDSTVLRNIGVPFAHSLIAFEAIKKGLSKLLLNQEKINEDLENNWTVVAEAIQTVLRSKNYPNPYEKLKELTRTNEKITQKTMHDFINSLNVDEQTKSNLLKITPYNYV